MLHELVGNINGYHMLHIFQGSINICIETIMHSTDSQHDKESKGEHVMNATCEKTFCFFFP